MREDDLSSEEKCGKTIKRRPFLQEVVVRPGGPEYRQVRQEEGEEKRFRRGAEILPAHHLDVGGGEEGPEHCPGGVL